MHHQNPFLSTDQKIVGDVYTSSEAMDNLIILCDDFGSRFGGTPSERQAAEFFKTAMEGYGLSNVHLEPSRPISSMPQRAKRMVKGRSAAYFARTRAASSNATTPDAGSPAPWETSCPS